MQMILEIAAGAYFSAASMYALILSLAGNFYRSKASVSGNQYLNKIAVLIPAYKEDSVIVSVAKKALTQHYDATSFDIIVIADSLKSTTLSALRALPIQVVEVSFESSTKVKALRAAVNRINQGYDIALILDADNVMEETFLHKISSAYNSGNRVLQGRRVAKNLNSSFAVLDAFSEIVNNHIFRKGAQALGWSSPFIGSGMSFPFHLLKNTLNEMESVGGFDRELQVRMVNAGYRITYLEDAVVRDEKVAKPEVFGNQRRRWLSSQFTYLRKFFKLGLKALFDGHWDLFNMTILNNIFLPRIIVLGLLGILTGLSLIFSKTAYFPSYFWIVLLGMQMMSILLAVPIGFYNQQFWIAILRVPQAFLIMCRSLLKVKGANKTFIHTPHAS